MEKRQIFEMKGHKYHYDELLFWLQKKYGDRLGLFLTNRLAKMIRKTGNFCINNLRVDKEKNIVEMLIYNKQKNNGCCDFYDKKLEFINDGKKEYYWIGFNFGH